MNSVIDDDILANSEEAPDESGAWVKDDYGIEYWVPGSLIDEFDEADASFVEDDQGFFDWFYNWRRDNRLQMRSERGRKSRRSHFGGSWSSFWKSEDKKPKYLSEWAFGGVHDTFAGSSDDTRKLAVALGAVGSTTRVLEPVDTRYTVHFSDKNGPMGIEGSFTNFDEKLISVSPKAILDRKIPEGQGIDITIGFALHEGSHAKYTAEIKDVILKPTAIKPVAVSSLMMNLAEDVRIERLTSEEFPGFPGYFETANAYLWEQQKDLAPKVWGPSLKDKVNAAILAVKWATEYEPIARGDAELSGEFDWWRAWVQRYLDGAPARGIVQEAIDHLAMDPEIKKEMDKVSEQEDALDELDDKIAAGLKEMAKKGKVLKVCPTPGRDQGTPGDARGADKSESISTEMRKKIEKLVREELKVDKPYIPWKYADSTRPTNIVVLRPDREAQSLNPLNGSLVARLRAAFKFRPVAREWHTRNLKVGRIDAPQLWRVADHDFRVFERKNIESKPDTSVTLLIDQSGSMGSTKLNRAIEAARVIHACLKDMNGVKVRVRSHTADGGDCGYAEAVVYRIWEQGEPVERLGMIHNLPHLDNADGYAIEWCVKELIDNTRPQEQRLLIVLSDGQPAAYCYESGWGYDHVRHVTDWADKNGVFVVQIAVDDALHMSEQSKMFKHWIPFQGNDKLPQQITGILRDMF